MEDSIDACKKWINSLEDISHFEKSDGEEDDGAGGD